MNEKIRFLIVDDQPDWKSAFEGSQSAKDYELTFAQSLSAVQAILNSGQQFDAAWVDIGLGDWDASTSMRSGEDAAERIQEQTGARIGIVSGWPGSEVDEIAERLGAVFISKTELESLPNVVNRILSGRTAQSQNGFGH